MPIVSIKPSTEALPEPLAILALADRRRALEARVAVGDLLGGEREIVRAGLDGQGQPLLACPRDHRQCVGRRQVDDVDVAAKLAAKLDHEPDRVVLPLTRPRREIARVAPALEGRRRGRDRRRAGQLGVDQQRHAGAGQLRHHRAEVGLGGVGELVDPRVAEERLEAEHAGGDRAARLARLRRERRRRRSRSRPRACPGRPRA